METVIKRKRLEVGIHEQSLAIRKSDLRRCEHPDQEAECDADVASATERIRALRDELTLLDGEDARDWAEHNSELQIMNP